MRYALVPTVIIALALLGCATPKSDTGDLEGGKRPKNQSFPLSQLKTKAKDLKHGMSMNEVRRLLGSPARIDGDRWTYLPNGGTLFLEKKLMVRFFGGQYVNHGYHTTYMADYAYPERGS